MTPLKLVCGRRLLDLSEPVVMGILNVTPDSFSDGGRYLAGTKPLLDRILRRVERMQREGATIIDVGGESTRPGAQAVSEAEEFDRVAPVVAALTERFDLVVSVDTSAPALMRAAIGLGAGMINDVRALGRPGAIDALREAKVTVCLMHMQGDPQQMQVDPRYEDVLAEVREFLMARADQCAAAGIGRDRIVIDPGFGFGKTLVHNFRLFSELDALVACGYPVLIGVSRKSMIGKTLSRPLHRRAAGGIALATLAASRGVKIIRTHDVAATHDALRMVAALAQVAPVEPSLS